MLGAVKNLDLKVMKFFARRQHPLIRDTMNSFSSLGSPVNSALFLVVIAYFSRALLTDLMLLIVLAWIAVYGLKHIVSRERPEGNLETGMTSSFPSGHAATAFVFAGTLAHSFPELRVVLYTVAVLVSFSRIYLQTHYLSDVLAGSAIGLLLVILF